MSLGHYSEAQPRFFRALPQDGLSATRNCHSATVHGDTARRHAFMHGSEAIAGAAVTIGGESSGVARSKLAFVFKNSEASQLAPLLPRFAAVRRSSPR